MSIYRIVKIDCYDHIVYRVQKRVLFSWWTVSYVNEDMNRTTKNFVTQREAEKWVAAQGFINTEVVVKEIRV